MNKAIMLTESKKSAVLLLGNGLNRTFRFDSWNEFFNRIKASDFTMPDGGTWDKIPNPLRAVVASCDTIGEKLKDISAYESALTPPDAEKELIKRFLQLPVEAILTTDYTYEIEKTMLPAFEVKSERRSKYRRYDFTHSNDKVQKALYTYMLPLAEGTPVWHIHGEAALPGTVVIGHYYYGIMVSYVQAYISDLMKRYKRALRSGERFAVKSWVDWFMMSDVHIVGQGLDLSEFDLWWLINCKKRNFPDTKVYWYERHVSEEKRMIAEAYRVNIVDVPVAESAGYAEFYEAVAEKIRRGLQ